MGNCSSNDDAPQSKALARHQMKEEQAKAKQEEEKKRAAEEEASLQGSQAGSFRVKGTHAPQGSFGASGTHKWARRSSHVPPVCQPTAQQQQQRRYTAPTINGGAIRPLVPPCDLDNSKSDEKPAFNDTLRQRSSPHWTPRATPIAVSPWSTGVRPVESTPKEDDWPRETAKSPLRSIASSNNDSVGPEAEADVEVEEHANTQVHRAPAPMTMPRSFTKPLLRQRSGSAPNMMQPPRSPSRGRSGSVPVNSPYPESPSFSSSRRRSLQYPLNRSLRSAASDNGTDCSSPTTARSATSVKSSGPRVGALRKNHVFARPPAFPGVVGKPTAVTL